MFDSIRNDEKENETLEDLNEFPEGVGSGSACVNQLHNNSDLFSGLFRQNLFA